ncbi:TPA: hypothetical protein EYO57_00440 [Candidatus Poribacteria bacterium]|nr:hypothetical protein [Candidatus Poribacteria bacterium]
MRKRDQRFKESSFQLNIPRPSGTLIGVQWRSVSIDFLRTRDGGATCLELRRVVLRGFARVDELRGDREGGTAVLFQKCRPFSSNQMEIIG